MNYREISKQQARCVLAILTQECGYLIRDPRDAEAFVSSIVATAGSDPWKVCREYRFCGALGYGGKFRNNGNNNNTPYVDCYPEDETPARLEMIGNANKQLAELFNGNAMRDQRSG